MSRFTEARNYGWPSLRVSSGPAELVFVPMLGGRLMGIRLDGDELLWVNPELAGLIPDLDSLPARFPLWGARRPGLRRSPRGATQSLPLISTVAPIRLRSATAG